METQMHTMDPAYAAYVAAWPKRKRAYEHAKGIYTAVGGSVGDPDGDMEGADAPMGYARWRERQDMLDELQRILDARAAEQAAADAEEQAAMARRRAEYAATLPQELDPPAYRAIAARLGLPTRQRHVPRGTRRILAEADAASPTGIRFTFEG